jgi:hypothetical protein
LTDLERSFDDDRVARAYVELPEGWGPARIVIVAWRNAGYDVAELRRLGTGPNLMLLNGRRPTSERPAEPTGRS